MENGPRIDNIGKNSLNLNEESKVEFFRMISSLRELFENFNSILKVDSQDNKGRYRSLSTGLSKYVGSLKNFNRIEEAEDLARLRMGIVLKEIQLILNNYNKTDSIIELEPAKLITHNLYNASQSYDAVGLIGENIYKQTLLATAKVKEIYGELKRAKELYTKIDPEKYKNKIEELTKKIYDGGIEYDGSEEEEERMEAKSYEVLVVFLDEIKNDPLIQMDPIMGIEVLISKLETLK